MMPPMMQMKRFDTRLSWCGYGARLTRALDSECVDVDSRLGPEARPRSFEQSLDYFASSPRELYLFQMTNTGGQAAFQCVVHVGRSKQLPFFAQARVPSMGEASFGDEEAAIECLSRLCARISGVMELRLQPLRLNQRGLMDFGARARRCGFRLADPLGVTRTLIVPLKDSPKSLLAALPSKTRSKLRKKLTQDLELKALSDPVWIPACKAAETASRGRTGAPPSNYDFEAVFHMARARPERARVIGLFSKSDPGGLLAYVVGFRSGEWAEYSSAGALEDARLRSEPFNYFLLWELMNWARSVGSLGIDLGGVTDGGERDPLRGISRFKRSWIPAHGSPDSGEQEIEREIGREMTKVIRPWRFLFYSMAKEAVRWGKNGEDQRQKGDVRESPVQEQGLQGAPPVLAR